jgi:hypothetical protein
MLSATIWTTVTLRYVTSLRKEEYPLSYPCNATPHVPDPIPFDHSRAAAFEERLVGALNPKSQTTVT